MKISVGGGFPGGASGKESACQGRRHKRRKFDFWVGKILGSGKWQPTPVFLLGKSHKRSLAGYSPWGPRESNTTEHLSSSFVGQDQEEI